MDLSVPKLSSCQESSASLGLYQLFATPAPAMSRSYSANTLTPGVIPSPLNFPSLTPPSSPFYSLYSPSPVQRASPMYDPAYLRKLKSNPIFRDLQSVLVQDCTQMQVPANLITTSWNLMQLNQTTTSDKQQTNTNTTDDKSTSNTNCEKVYLRHIKLQDKILKVRIDPAVSADGLKVENDYSEQVGKIEMDRYRALNSCPAQIKTTINDYYDKERLSLAERTEAELDELVKKAEKLRQSVNIMNNLKGDANKDIIKTESTKQLCEKLSGKVDGASLLLQTDDKMNAVRKLQFNTSDENINNINNNDDDDDYLNCSVNSEDFEIDEIDVETVDKDEKPTHVIVKDSVSVPKEDLLQKCLTESGISPQPHQPASPELNTSSTSTDNTTSSEGRSSPMSLDSVKSTSSPNTDNNNSYGTQSTPELSTIQSTTELSTNQIPAVSKFESIPNNQQSPFSLPSMYHPASFLQPDNINMTLSYMQKICSAPAVTFTPESRRDFTPAFTPDFTPKMLPLSELSHNYSTDNFHHRYPTSSHSSPYLGLHHTATQPGTINPATWCTESSLQGTSHRPTSQSKKRKSPCDEVEGHTDIVNNNNNKNNQNTHIDSNTDNIDGDFELKNPVFRTHRMLTPESTNILSNWYYAHVHYPYPNDEEVEQLAKMTNITTRQVKKWMANKRVRCFNTLSITGNQHPIKYKYKGQERKKKQTTPALTQSDKENNCDSTTSDKKPNYSTLSESAKVILNDWYDQHVTNPYPNEEEKRQLAETCSITVSQVKSWFANKRNRTNNTKRQVPNYFLNKHPEYSQLVHLVGQKREESRMIKRRKINEVMYIQPQFYF